MHVSLLALLACPACRGDLTLEATDSEPIEQGELTCRVCGRHYPVVRGIPRLFADTLTPDERRTVSAFGSQWNAFDDHPQVDSASFWSYCQPLLGPEDFARRLVLDVGCGAGRHLPVVAASGARTIVGVDLSDSVEAAKRRTQHLPNVDIVQASALALPFKDVFEVAFSVGVLHHLPHPGAGFLEMSRCLRPGGRALAWIYGREGNWPITYIFDPVRRLLLSRLPFSVNRRLAGIVSPLLWWLADRAYPSILRAVPRGQLPLAAYLEYVRSLGPGFAYWITLDQMIPTLTHYISRAEFASWFASAGLTRVQILPRSNNSWRGAGTRPPA